MDKNLPLSRGVWIEIKPTDWVLGAESAIPFESRCKDWSPYLPTFERQRNDLFDSNCCVTYSGLNIVETQIYFLLKNNLLPQRTVDFLTTGGYLDENGRPNFNDAFSAKMNGTTINGNNLFAFWESIAKVGVIPQKDWIDVKTAKRWEDLMIEIPQNLIDKGKVFLQYFDIKYEWTLLGTPNSDTLLKNTEHAPLHVATPVCLPWNTSDKILSCGDKRLSHATTVYGGVSGEVFFDLDHYQPAAKKLAWDYYLPYAVKGIVSAKKTIQGEELPTFVFKRFMKFGDIGEDVKTLQKILHYYSFFKYPINTGFYGENTRKAVMDFQFFYKIAPQEELIKVNGKICGPKTLAKLNSLAK